MQNRDHNSEDIQKLEGEIRKLGIPYASQEPEPLYWANFRVRVMERVAEKEMKANWPARFGQYIAQHVLGAGIAASAACLLVAGILWLQPSGEAPRIAAVQPPAAAPAPIAQPPSQVLAETTTVAHQAHRTHASYAVVNKRLPTEDLASAEEPLVATDDETPVGLQSLSQPELESVLHGLQTNE